MARFLVEVPHEADEVACARAIQTFLVTGSHFLANADWGCPDGEHKAWIVLDAESRETAQSIVPPSFRPQAKIVRLDRFTMEDVVQILGHHES
jgi:hypothetical protein